MFWATYPWWKHLTRSPFSSFPIQPATSLPLPPHGTSLLLYDGTLPPSDSILRHVCHFLSLHFAPTPAHPMLHHTSETLLGANDSLYVLLSDSASQDILGTLRYHYIGTFHRTGKPLYVVDAFCIHPAWRKKGLATFLLAVLQHTATTHGRPHALFLKEGTPLPYPVPPAISGHYVYRELPPERSVQELDKIHLSPLSDTHARSWMNHYLSSFPDTFLILPPLPSSPSSSSSPSSPSSSSSPSSPSSSSSLSWFAYRRVPVSVLVGVQDAHQTWKGNDRSIGWVTVWLETPTTTEDDRRIIVQSLVPLLSPRYRWLWMNRAWVGGDTRDPEWQEDGPFQWYTYQWATGQSSHPSYGIPC